MNPDTAIYLGVVAAVALILKATILFNVEIKSKVAESFVVLCLFFIVMNAAEFLAYFTYVKSVRIGEFFAHFYMNSLFYVFPAILILALSLTKFKHMTVARITLYSIAGLITLAYLNSLVVSGWTFIGWSVSAVPGQFYWLALIFIVLCSLATVGHLVRHLYLNPDIETRYNCKIYLMAFSPILVVEAAVILLKLAGFNSSSVISLPIAILIFLYVLLLHTNGNLFWLSTKIKSVFAVIRMEKDAPVEAIINEIEKVRIQEALKLTNGQQKSAANILGIPASTLNKRISKHKISAVSFK